MLFFVAEEFCVTEARAIHREKLVITQPICTGYMCVCVCVFFVGHLDLFSLAINQVMFKIHSKIVLCFSKRINILRHTQRGELGVGSRIG